VAQYGFQGLDVIKPKFLSSQKKLLAIKYLILKTLKFLKGVWGKLFTKSFPQKKRSYCIRP